MADEGGALTKATSVEPETGTQYPPEARAQDPWGLGCSHYAQLLLQGFEAGRQA